MVDELFASLLEREEDLRNLLEQGLSQLPRRQGRLDFARATDQLQSKRDRSKANLVDDGSEEAIAVLEAERDAALDRADGALDLAGRDVLVVRGGALSKGGELRKQAEVVVVRPDKLRAKGRCEECRVGREDGMGWRQPVADA